MKRIVTCEQVSQGHPDKIADQISDLILTYYLKNDRNSRVAVETLIKNKQIVIAGEVTSTAEKFNQEIIIKLLEDIGLVDAKEYQITDYISEQSGDIAIGVDTGGAGDQGMMFGYATNETKQMLPIPYVIATDALINLKKLNHKSLLPDAKSQVSYDYENERIDTFLISSQHTKETSLEEVRQIIEEVMDETARQHGLDTDFRKLINPTGVFVIGGADADAGLTGRKIIADTYGGVGHHGGGAFSGKDPTKVDRSGAYMARHIAKIIVASGYADKCEIQVAYAIGVSEPVSLNVETFGTNKVEIERIIELVRNIDFRPKTITEQLDLLDVDYLKTASYGHFTDQSMPWERIGHT